MDFSQSNLFGYIEDLQELTIIERPVRRSLKVYTSKQNRALKSVCDCVCFIYTQLTE